MFTVVEVFVALTVSNCLNCLKLNTTTMENRSIKGKENDNDNYYDKQY